MKYDFCGWVTRNDVKCSDGRTIRKNAFQHNDGEEVPLVWAHDHNSPFNVLGKVLLENRDAGVYGYGTFNATEAGEQAKLLVQHGDVKALSIFANRLQQTRDRDVLHGSIKEVSLVLAGANPEAKIENVIRHGEEYDDEAYIFSGCALDELSHSDDESDEKNEDKKEEKNMAENKDKTVQDVINSMTEEQQNVLYAMVGQALKEGGAGTEEEEEEEVKHNLFDQDEIRYEDTLSHDEMKTIIDDGKRYGSLKESFLQHAQEYGIENIDYLFPDAKSLNNPPEFISREMGWVQKVMQGTHHSPFSRIKSMFADITEDEARAKGYIKGKLKKEEVFSLLKRTTTPTTVYKKQKMDRDDVIDITDFDVIAWLKSEMRIMLDEELARAILVGDGRLASSDDKINETNIRPIWKDEELYTIKVPVEVTEASTADEKAKTMIKKIIKARKNYKGSGNPTLFTTEDMLTDMLLLEDNIGRELYSDEAALARKLRVKEIITVPVMENLTRTEGADTFELAGLIVNLADYNVGADKGGSVNMFDDFDIDYNQQKYLIETRCSGALIKPYSAIAVEFKKANASG